jgi:VIT1/CCC1 family predicted Fe2+/Mn2+ transporter
LLPIAAVLLAPPAQVQPVTIAATLIALSISGALAGWTGGASVIRGAWRVVFWGALAMAATSLVGKLFNVQV